MAAEGAATQTGPSVLEEIAKLKRMTWAQLIAYGLRNDLLTVARCQEAVTRDELRLAILKARFPKASD
jgi:hypothetical protein